MTNQEEIIAIVGLGYVGLPLAVAFAKKWKVIGFDIDQRKIELLCKGIDPTKSVEEKEVKTSQIQYTDDPLLLEQASLVIVCVPTPLKQGTMPDLGYLEKASALVGKHMKEDAIIVYESTVYPGVTEDVCEPILEKVSGKKCGKDFSIGYSPERINPGDHEHTLTKMIKVVSGKDEKTRKKIAAFYSSVLEAGVYEAPSIKVAEAAKVIENTQRDLNIALMNELSVIFRKLGIDTHEVLQTAATKWNFHKYYPGLVGGHCIGIDPYYLTYRAKQLGYEPKVILAGREINDAMHKEVLRLVKEGLAEIKKSLRNTRVLLMGLTFKENVNDTRNSRVLELKKELEKEGSIILHPLQK